MIKAVDLKGQRFGRLVAIELTTPKKGRTVWKCKCDCGNEKDVVYSSLAGNKTSSCGCLKSNLFIGTVINRLTLVKPTGEHDSGGYRKWKCLCFCGNTVVYSAKRLLYGKVVSCGCLGTLDITNQRFGRLTAIKPYSKTNSVVTWICKCECGNEHLANGTLLRSGGVKSCGCILRDNQYETIKNIAYSVHQREAVDRGYVSELTFIQYCEIASRPCVYCNKFSIRKNQRTKATLQFNSVDRRDNEPYYKLENSQSVCFDCNEMKMARTDKEFREHLQSIFQHLKM
jgi:hypothetical protein